VPDPNPTDRDPQQLSKIVDFDDVESPWQAHEMAAVLRHQLAAPMVFGPEDGAWGSGRAPATFGELLCRTDPPLPLLKLMKDFARAHTIQPHSPIPREIATVLYYAAILAALVRHGARISGLDDEPLRKGVQAVLLNDWLDESTRTLLTEGLCQLMTSEEPT
jgi:hypothetical protein